MARRLGILCIAGVAALHFPTAVGAEVPDTLRVLFSFTGGIDGATPLATLAAGSHSRLYGTTSAGANGSGTVFEIVPGRKLKTLYAFCSQKNCIDGSAPRGGVILDSAGNAYGTVSGGGANGEGAVFELTAKGQINVLYSFCSVISNGHCGDGSVPVAGLARDSSGNLFGTTSLGGANNQGTVFELHLDAKKSEWNETVLYSFCALAGCVDGEAPLAGVAIDRSGYLYGTTQLGGANGQGTVFRVRPRGRREDVLYSFCTDAGCADGAEPNAGVTIGAKGELYGTTKYGGNAACGNGGGVVFRVAGESRETLLYTFCSVMADADGSYPEADVIVDGKGRLYGTTSTGGSAGGGVVFEISGNTETVLYDFCSDAGCPTTPAAGVIVDKAGDVFGTTSQGGKDGLGTVFQLLP